MSIGKAEFTYLCSAHEILGALVNGDTLRLATIGIMREEKPAIVMVGDVARANKNMAAFVEYDWNDGDIPAYLEMKCRAILEPNDITSFGFKVTEYGEIHFDGRESDVIRSIESYGDAFPTYAKLFGKNTKNVTDDVVSVVSEVLGKSIVNLIPTPYQKSSATHTAKQSEHVLFDIGERFIAQIYKDSIVELFNSTINLVAQSAKHIIASVYNGIDIEDYAIGIIMGDDNLLKSMRGIEVIEPVEQMRIILNRIGIDSLWIDSTTMDAFRNAMDALIDALPGIDKRDLYVLYHGLDAFIERQKALLMGVDVVSASAYEMFGGFSLN